MRVVATVAMLASLVLAGCSEGSAPRPAATDQDFQDLGLQATQSTGVIRGVVVDDAVRPVAEVAISINGPTQRQATTKADGLFGFDGLEPGTYFIQANRPGYAAAQQSAEVVAGVNDPPIVKILLAADAASGPRVVTYIFDGFIECSVSFVAAGLAACSTIGYGNDRFLVEYELDDVPDFAQAEMHWKSTQAVSPNLALLWSRSVPGQTLLDNWVEDRGPSPLLIQADKARIEEVGLGSDIHILTRVFNEPADGTNPGCIPRPVLGGCTTGAGVTISQAFTVLTNVFYGVVPPEGWLYAEQGPYKP